MGELALTQRFQRVGGTLTLRGSEQPVLGAYVEGDVLGFTFVDLDGGVRSVRARVAGGALAGLAAFRRHARRRSPGGEDRIGRNGNGHHELSCISVVS